MFKTGCQSLTYGKLLLLTQGECSVGRQNASNSQPTSWKRVCLMKALEKKKEIEKYIIGSRKKTALSSEWVWCLGWKIDMGEPVCQGSQFTQRPLCKRLLYPEQVAKEGCRRTCLFYLYSCLSPCASHYVKTEDFGKYLLGLREAQRSPWWLGRHVWLLTDRDTISTREYCSKWRNIWSSADSRLKFLSLL